MMNRCVYTIGLDYGSLSCRGVLVRTDNGQIAAVAEYAYPHGILDEYLPDGTALGGRFSLQHPSDYLEALECVVKSLMSTPGIEPESVAAVCVDFTSCTVLPVDENLSPLSEKEKFHSRPHAWNKLWKHGSATRQAEKIHGICAERKSEYLNWYGGKISPLCLLAKVVEVFDEDREVFDTAFGFMEAADWVTSKLVGKPVFGYAQAAAKAFYSRESGYPDDDFFSAIDPELRGLAREKLMLRFTDRAPVSPWEPAGKLSQEMAKRLGLSEECIVSGPQMDGYAPLAALGIYRPGSMMMIVGTSTAMMLPGEENRPVEGVMACVQDAFYPGMWAYASGQASVGDGFQWFVDNCVPAACQEEARKKGISVHQHLTELSKDLEPGATGIIALDWYNGNKSCLVNSKLSGLFLGINLNTRPEHIFRAMMEATAFGARAIIEGYRQSGVPVDDICICGGIAVKNPTLMQIYADVFGMPVKVSRCSQAAALGAAIYAAAAAGERTGYKDIFEASEGMADKEYTVYAPSEKRRAAYDELYREYIELHDYFGRGANRVMERMYDRRH